MLELFQGAEVADGGCSIIGEVGSGALCGVAGGLSETSVIVAQGGDAVAGEVVGNDSERFVIEECFVTVLETAARDEEKYATLTF